MIVFELFLVGGNVVDDEMRLDRRGNLRGKRIALRSKGLASL